MGADKGDVRDPERIRRNRVKLQVQTVVRGNDRTTAIGEWSFLSTYLVRYPCRTCQTPSPVEAHAFGDTAQIVVQLAASPDLIIPSTPF